MPFGQSLPISAVVGTLCGIAAGEVARAIADDLGADEDQKRVAAQVSHGLTSIASGWAVNATLGLDATGAVAQTAVSGITAISHDALAGAMFGKKDPSSA